MSKNIHEGIPLFSKSIYEDGVIEHIDYDIERRNALFVETTAVLLRSYSSAFRFGPQWAEARFGMAHHKAVYVQASQSAFIIQLTSPENVHIRETNARWDRELRILSSFSMWGPNTAPLLWYTFEESDARMPNTCNRWQASHAFTYLLEEIS